MVMYVMTEEEIAEHHARRTAEHDLPWSENMVQVSKEDMIEYTRTGVWPQRSDTTHASTAAVPAVPATAIPAAVVPAAATTTTITAGLDAPITPLTTTTQQQSVAEPETVPWLPVVPEDQILVKQVKEMVELEIDFPRPSSVDGVYEIDWIGAISCGKGKHRKKIFAAVKRVGWDYIDDILWQDIDGLPRKNIDEFEHQYGSIDDMVAAIQSVPTQRPAPDGDSRGRRVRGRMS